MDQNNFFKSNHRLLGLLDLPVVWWFGKMSVFHLSGHLSTSLSHDIYIYIYIYIRFVWFFAFGQKYAKIKAHICWKRQSEKWTFRFWENFYHLNLLEIILNENSYNFCFLIENSPHIFRKVIDFDMLPKNVFNQSKWRIF